MAFVALVIVFYLSANLCFTFAANTTSVNANDGHSSSNAALSHLHHDKTMSLMVCNCTVIFCLSTSCMSWGRCRVGQTIKNFGWVGHNAFGPDSNWSVCSL